MDVDAPARGPKGGWAAPFAAGLVGAACWVLLFGLPHAIAAVQLDRVLCHRNPAACAATSPTRETASWLAPALVDYAGYALAGILLVIGGRRRLFVVPAVASTLVPWLIGSPAWGGGYGGRFVHLFWWLPHPARVRVSAPPPWIAHMGLGTAMAFALVLLPAVALVMTTRRAEPRRPTPAGLAGLVACTGTIGLAAWALGPFDLFRWGDGASAVSIGVVAAGVGLSRSRRSAVAVVLMPVLLTGLASYWATSFAWNGLSRTALDPGPLESLTGLLPWLALALVAASWEQVVPLLRRMKVSPAAA